MNAPESTNTDKLEQTYGIVMLSIPQLTKALQCSRAHIYHLINSGQLIASDISVKGSIRTRTRVQLADFNSFLRQSEIKKDICG
jgi:hypothetical protein